jgi:ferritin
MLSKKLEEALNKQVTAEFYSAHLYLSMSAYFSEKNLPGFANWMNVQYQEESSHALKLYNYIIDRGGKVTLEKIDAPPVEWKSLLDVVEETYKHEQHVTSLINDLVDLAIHEKDHATVNLLQWYIAEQVEEEANVGSLLEDVKMASESSSAILMLDRELRGRKFTPIQ